MNKTDYERKYTNIFRELTLSDDEWDSLSSYFPEVKYKGIGRRPVSNRQVFQALLYLLAVPVTCRYMKRLLGVCDEVIRARLDCWVHAGVFQTLWGISIDNYSDLVGLDLTYFLVDGCLTKSVNGGEKTGKSPVDRGKSGTKRSLGTDASGIPLALIQAPASCHDTNLLELTLEGIKTKLSEANQAPSTYLAHLDRGYRGPIAANAAERQGFTLIIPGKEVNRQETKKRSPVECCHKKFNCFRGLLFRQFRSEARQDALLMIAAAIITWRACSRKLVGRTQMY